MGPSGQTQTRKLKEGNSKRETKKRKVNRVNSKAGTWKGKFRRANSEGQTQRANSKGQLQRVNSKGETRKGKLERANSKRKLNKGNSKRKLRRGNPITKLPNNPPHHKKTKGKLRWSEVALRATSSHPKPSNTKRNQTNKILFLSMVALQAPTCGRRRSFPQRQAHFAKRLPPTSIKTQELWNRCPSWRIEPEILTPKFRQPCCPRIANWRQ